MRGNPWAVAFTALGFVAGGCAHEQQVKTEQAPPPAPVVQKEAPPAAPEARPPSQESEDLEALLRGTVIHFEYNQDLLTADSRDRLQKLAEVMRKRGDAAIKIAGNCDERGTEEYNIALGQRRAEVARKYMVSLGVAPKHIDTVSFGKERPVDDRHTEDAWTANRRDEFQPVR
jgi:peptidoglycan-associated lipoprotein